MVTSEQLMNDMRAAYNSIRQSPAPAFPGFGSVPIIVTENALAETERRLFPASKHRSRRIQKKLIKRFGGEFEKVPTILQTQQGFVMHPDRHRAFLAELERRK